MPNLQRIDLCEQSLLVRRDLEPWSIWLSFFHSVRILDANSHITGTGHDAVDKQHISLAIEPYK